MLPTPVPSATGLDPGTLRSDQPATSAVGAAAGGSVGASGAGGSSGAAAGCRSIGGVSGLLLAKVQVRVQLSTTSPPQNGAA